jgi:hypothetical protein
MSRFLHNIRMGVIASGATAYAAGYSGLFASYNANEADTMGEVGGLVAAIYAAKNEDRWTGLNVFVGAVLNTCVARMLSLGLDYPTISSYTHSTILCIAAIEVIDQVDQALVRRYGGA